VNHLQDAGFGCRLETGSEDEEEAVDNELISERIQVERKLFYFDLKENDRGRFLRITEDVNGRRDAIVVPVSGLEAFRSVLDRVIDGLD
jgi:hypothetical protein